VIVDVRETFVSQIDHSIVNAAQFSGMLSREKHCRYRLGASVRK